MTRGTKPPAGHSTATLVLGVILLLAQGCAGRIRPALPPQTPPTPASPAVVSPMTFMATAYCKGTATSVGTPVAEGIVAADPKLLPIGTVIRVTGLSKSYRGDYTVMDTGPRIRGRRLDVYIADCAQAVRFGRRSVGVTVLRQRN
jgi:3D (Asp-Asp-Asp) domain-containing protein